MLLPATVEQLAASELASRRRPPWRPIILVVAMVLAGGGAGIWILSRQSSPSAQLSPSVTITPDRSNAVVERFGEASPVATQSAAARSGPIVAPTRSQPSSVPPTVQVQELSLLMHYPFNEASGTSAADAGASGKAATVEGAAAFVPGRLGNAIKFSGPGQYVSFPAGALAGLQEFTLAAWVRLDTVDTWSRVFDFGSNTTVNMFLTPRSDAGTARFAITTGGNTKQQRINAPAPLPAGAWTHVAVTISAGVGILYLNRAEVARTQGMTLTPASLGNTTQNWVGRSQYQADPYLRGTVDDLRIYGRALSAAELAALP